MSGPGPDPAPPGHQTEDLAVTMLIGGRHRPARAGARFRAGNPYTERSWATIPDASTADVDEAVAAARAAADRRVWARLPARERGRQLIDLAGRIEAETERLARLETLDTGKLLRETRRQVRFAAQTWRYYGELADKLDGGVRGVTDPDLLNLVVREPVGVCALLTAWNSPMQLLGNKLPAALAAGNTAVVRPSEHAAVSTAYLGELVTQAGFPPGVVNIVTSRDAAGARHLATHPGVDLVSLTGGVATGRAVARAAADRLARVVLELGGKSPNIVFADADLDAALDGVVGGIFAAGGQTCVAGSRVYLQRPVFDAFVDRLARYANAMSMGDPLRDGTDLGPLANQPHHARVAEYVADGIRAGARPVTGGPDHPRLPGLFVPPTIFVDVDGSMAVAREEIFGPVAVAIPFDHDDEVVAAANASKLGLAAGVWTQDLSRALRIAPELDAGTVWVNTYRQVEPAAPFGGVKQSGIGRERGVEGLLEYTRVKNLMIKIGPGRGGA